jgi:predicted RNase H-related nuclease YkuK (DUF458 family)
MNLTFKSLTDRKPIDLISYIKNYLLVNPETSLYIGCDSQNTKRSTTYATVIVLYNRGRGGHVLYTVESIPIINDRFTRLWREVEQSIELAEMLKAEGIQKPVSIDLDLNPDPKYKSNQLLRAALGYVEAMGYIPRCKPNAMCASYVADALCH